jgi:hypothetical protein
VQLKPDVVICFENSAAGTFSASKRIGAKCILDAPSIHYNTAYKFIGIKINA